MEWIIRMSRVHVTTLNVATQPFVLQIYVHRAHIYVSACVCARTSRRQDVRMCVALRTARDHDIVQLRYATLIQPLSSSLLLDLLHLSARTHDPLLNSSSTPGKPQLRILRLGFRAES